MSNVIFQSALPAEVLGNVDSSRAIQALAATGMNIMNVNESPDIKEFGKKIFVAGVPALAVGAQFMIARPVQVEGTDRAGNKVSYDAFVIVLSTGEERILAATNLLTAWVAQPEDMSAAQLKTFENHDKSLQVIREFYRDHNAASTVNSPAAGFKAELSVADRIGKLSAGVITVRAVASFEFDFEKNGESGTGRQRLYAFAADNSAGAIKQFAKDVKASSK